ncbi:MAG TPA: hypothetical protein VMF89_29590 [Polyangiales bacterium]|nr:hypothetical protein [Polyangiales bacterium]
MRTKKVLQNGYTIVVAIVSGLVTFSVSYDSRTRAPVDRGTEATNTVEPSRAQQRQVVGGNSLSDGVVLIPTKQIMTSLQTMMSRLKRVTTYCHVQRCLGADWPSDDCLKSEPGDLRNVVRDRCFVWELDAAY